MRYAFVHVVRSALAPAFCLVLSLALARPASPAEPPVPSVPRARPSAPRSVVESQNTFAFEFYRRLATDSRDNLFCSPYSLYTALAIVAEGARGETARDMGRMLALPSSMRRGDHARPWSLASLHAALAVQRRAFAREGASSSLAERAEFDSLRARFARADAHALTLRNDGAWDAAIEAQKTAANLAEQVNEMGRRLRLGELSLCDALWIDSRCAIPTALVNAITPAYGAVLQQARFSSDPEAARHDINAWVASRTFNRVPEVLGRGEVTALTTLVVTDAVAFRGDWEKEFEHKNTREQIFRTVGGDSVRVPFMWRMGPMRYGAFHADGSRFVTPATYRTDQRFDRSKLYPEPGGFQFVELPYRGSGLAMIVLLPSRPQDLVFLESLLTPAALERWIGESALRRAELHLPRFRFARGGDVTPALSAMGLARACDPERAELPGLVECRDLRARQSIGGVIHRADIEVNEQGTVAVAATVINVRMGMAVAPDESPFIPSVRADHPFVFLIRDRSSGAILFIGRCARP